jgi:xeroderma pigmentosum group C-complementing protein
MLQNLTSISVLLRPYAPCLLGFEGRGGSRTPTITGIVVHAHNEELLREAHVEMASQLLEEENEKHRKAVLGRWKRLLAGVLIKERLKQDYGDE